jgi:branched-chain amino acid transport system substrate-binding protein
LAAGASPAAAQAPRTVYVSLPQVGAGTGQDVVRGAQMALADHGGQAGGGPIAMQVLDNASPRTGRWTPARTARNARRAAGDPAAIAYIGEYNSAASAISIPITNEAGLLQVSPSNTYDGLTRRIRGVTAPGDPDRLLPTGRRTFGRIAPADRRQASAVARRVDELGLRRVLVVDDAEVYGAGMARMIAGELDRLGVDVVRRSLRSGVTVRSLRRARADALVYGGIAHRSTVRLFDTLNRAHPGWPLFGTDGVTTPGFAARLRAPAARRAYFVAPRVAPEALPPAGQAFVARFRAQFGEPDPYAVFGYEAMAVVLDAIDRAADPVSRSAVIDAFFATRDRASVLGTYSIDRFGDTTLRTFGGYVVRDGALAFDRAL